MNNFIPQDDYIVYDKWYDDPGDDYIQNELLSFMDAGYGTERYPHATDIILDAVAWKMYKDSQSPFLYSDITGRGLTYEDFKEAVHFGHQKYGSPNLELLDEDARAHFIPGGLEVAYKGIPDYDYEGFNTERLIFTDPPSGAVRIIDLPKYVYETDDPNTLYIPKGEGIYRGWEDEMAHQLQFYDLDAEMQDSLVNEAMHQRDLYGDVGRERHIVNEPVDQPLIDVLSMFPLVGDIFDGLKEYEEAYYNVYDIASQIPGDHREGHPTVEFDAHKIKQPAFRQELIDYLKNLANE